MLTLARCGTRDLARARAFYDEIAAILGAKVAFAADTMVAYSGAKGGTFIIGLPLAGEASVGNGTQFSFTAPDQAAVAAAHDKALELGAVSEGEPGYRGPEERGFYAAYFRDPDGNKLMVYHSPNM